MKTQTKILLLTILWAFLLASCGEADLDEHQFYNNDSVPEELTEAETAEKFVTKIGEEDASVWTMWILIGSSLVFSAGLVYFFSRYIPLGLWYKAVLSGIRVSWWKLIKMRFQDIPQELILENLIEAQNAGLKLDPQDLMEKYLAEVNIELVVDTGIRAVNAGIEMSFNDLAAKFLAKVDVETVMHALITAKNADLELTINELASHYLANVDVIQVVEALITAHNAGYDDFTLDELKEHYLANGDVTRTVDAFVAAKKAKIQDITFEDIAAIDLSKIDVFAAIQAAINPRVVETSGVSGVARDGVQLFMKLKLTVKANLKNIIGGAAEDTVMARVNESLSSEIGKAKSHYDILENPFELADIVEQKSLGDDTAFHVVSIDVSDIKIGKDVHAELAVERAHAQAEQAKAELIMAEEKVQKAMAAAFINGKLSVHEYHEMQNTEADTLMRKQLGNSTVKKESGGHAYDHNKDHDEDHH